MDLSDCGLLEGRELYIYIDESSYVEFRSLPFR